MAALIFFMACPWAALKVGASPALAAASLKAETYSEGTSRPAGPRPAARDDRFMGTGNSGTGGFSTTYTDPETGDSITRVVPPQNPNQIQPPVPIYIYPQVEPQWPPKNPSQPLPVPPLKPVPQPRGLPDPYNPALPSNPSLFQPEGR